MVEVDRFGNVLYNLGWILLLQQQLASYLKLLARLFRDQFVPRVHDSSGGCRSWYTLAGRSQLEGHVLRRADGEVHALPALLITWHSHLNGKYLLPRPLKIKFAQLVSFRLGFETRAFSFQHHNDVLNGGMGDGI